MIDEQAPQWFVDAQRGTFDVGDRVRIRLSECEYCAGDRTNGCTGVVAELEHEPPYRGYDEDFASHHVWVVLDNPPPNVGAWNHYAPIELEPADPPA